MDSEAAAVFALQKVLAHRAKKKKTLQIWEVYLP